VPYRGRGSGELPYRGRGSGELQCPIGEGGVVNRPIGEGGVVRCPIDMVPYRAWGSDAVCVVVAGICCGTGPDSPIGWVS
jgi:hypothetical protein